MAGVRVEGQDHAWKVSWLPGRCLDRNSAITAMVLADATGRGDMNQRHRLWVHLAGRAAELGLTAPGVLAMTTHTAGRTGAGEGAMRSRGGRMSPSTGRQPGPDNTPPAQALVPPQASSPENSPPAERLAYCVDEAARLTGLSGDLLYDEMRRGHLDYLKIGRRRIITRQHLEQFLAIAPKPQPTPAGGPAAADRAP